MEYIQAAVYGIVQGLTEFLPISSTAHLRIVPAVFGWADPGAAYSAVIQIGTVLAVILYFRRDIVSIVGAFFSGLKSGAPFANHQTSVGWYIIAGSIPISVCGMFLKKYIEGDTIRSLTAVACTTLFFGVLLLVAELAGKRTKSIESVGWRESQTMGLMQVLALIPGASRSGVTITAGLFSGLNREAAARFSFLLSIPAVTAAGLFEMKDAIKHGPAAASSGPLLAATLVSFVTGYLCIAFFLKYLKTRSTIPFAIYRIALAAAILVLLR